MKIGFRVPYDYVVPEFACMYFEYFQFLECKVKGKSSSASVLKYLQNIPNSQYSIHLEKDALYNEEAFKSTILLLTELKKVGASNIFFVTHFSGDCSYARKKIAMIADALPSESMLLLENAKVSRANYKYLESLKNFTKADKRCGICLDIGHYLSECLLEGINQTSAIQHLKGQESFRNQVLEIHIHNYIQGHDHLNLGTGQLDFSQLCTLKFDKCKVCIIETQVIDPECDGTEQVNLLKTKWGDLCGD